MKESFEEPKPQFKWPDIEAEWGEFDRVAKRFEIDESVLMFQARNGELVDLDEDMWSNLENTDSNRFLPGGLEAAHRFAAEVGRDSHNLLHKIEAGEALDAPIIMQIGDIYHLVAGNTRLMVARAKGVTPKVLLFSVDV